METSEVKSSEHRPILGRDLISALQAAGVLGPHVQRAIIEIDTMAFVRIYVRQLGDDRLLAVNWSDIKFAVAQGPAPASKGDVCSGCGRYLAGHMARVQPGGQILCIDCEDKPAAPQCPHCGEQVMAGQAAQVRSDGLLCHQRCIEAVED